MEQQPKADEKTITRALRLLACQKNASKRYYQAHKEAIKERSVNYWERHRDAINARRRARYEATHAENNIPPAV